MRRRQTASQDSLPLPPLIEVVDPLVLQNTRFNEARTHRYTLFRHWGDPANYVAIIGMNPSGADEDADDATIAKETRIVRGWGFGALYKLNAFALRATNSAELYK